ncbi:hypothetical protein ACP26L_32070 [Paenibacillus sp. S-38]|uniref:hypothetical protein n=1 Tax=Paenibacillus sp. S-38 TaxID=3416710 RepID=UPI003CE76E24
MSKLIYTDESCYPPPRGRGLSHEEQYWLQFGLQHMEREELRGGYLAQLDGLEVTASCDCGEPTCVTVRFAGTGSEHADRLVELELQDGRRLLIRHRQGRLAELELI